MNEGRENFSRQALVEQLEDAMLRCVIFEREAREAQAFAAEARERTAGLGDGEIDQACKRSFPRFSRALARENLPRGKHRALRACRLAAYAALLVYLLATVAVAASENARVYLARLLVTSTPSYTELRFEAGDSFVEVPLDWPGQYYPAAIPQGYSRQRVWGNEMAAGVSFADPEGKLLIFSEYAEGTVMRVDSECASRRTVDLNGNQALVVEDENHTKIAWSDFDRFLLIEFDGPAQEALEVAGAVTRIN